MRRHRAFKGPTDLPAGQKAGEKSESPAGPAGPDPALCALQLSGGAGGRPDPGKVGMDPAAPSTGGPLSPSPTTCP